MRASVVVPVRGRPELLKQCLIGLSTQTLPQTEYEVVVCDDGSLESLQPTVSQFREPLVRLLSQKPSGPAAARNLGIRFTDTPLVIFLDSDVMPDRELVQLLVEALDSHPEWQGAEACLIPTGHQEGPLWEAPAAATGGRYHTAAIGYRREALAAAGGFDERFPLPACEDVELAMRILNLGPIGFVPLAKAFHPRRRVTLSSRWRQRWHWKYILALAERYGILGFPDRPVGRFPRMRVAAAATVLLPVGRLLEGCRHAFKHPRQAPAILMLGVVDILAGLSALPDILFAKTGPRRAYINPASPCQHASQL